MDNPDTGGKTRRKTATFNGEPACSKTNSTKTAPGTSEYRQTVLLLAKMMVTIFLCEAAIMALLAVVPLSRHWSILMDPVLLTVLGTPLLYWLLVRPIQRALEDRRRAEKRLVLYQQELKSLASQLSLTEDRERRRLATELHDQIGQSLISCKVKLDRVRMGGPPGKFAGSIQEICDDLREIVEHTRKLMFDLSYPILHELGIEPALEEWLDKEISQKHGIRAEFEDDHQTKPLVDDVRMVLFRNVRELLGNVVERAGATVVKVSVCRADPDIRITMENDGARFDRVEAEASDIGLGRLGLLGIRERLEQIGGIMEIVSETGLGTRISMTAPLAQTETEKTPQGASPPDSPSE